MPMNSHRPTSPAGTADAADVFNLPPKTSAGREFSRSILGCIGLSALAGGAGMIFLWNIAQGSTLAFVTGAATVAYGASALMVWARLRQYHGAMLKSICDERMAVDNYRMAASTYRQRLLELERVNRMFKAASVDVPYTECEILPFGKRVH